MKKAIWHLIFFETIAKDRSYYSIHCNVSAINVFCAFKLIYFGLFLFVCWGSEEYASKWIHKIQNVIKNKWILSTAFEKYHPHIFQGSELNINHNNIHSKPLKSMTIPEQIEDEREGE